ncbi:RNA ligase, DRB0094 family [Xylariomycetidae sp. FL2044]|nr:RNA ligase, DRB0094 family [Xylariomycetidae sp. FL2044]
MSCVRKLVTVRLVSELRPVLSAPTLAVAVIDGWTCAVRRGAFKEGDLVVFFEIDSFLPSPKTDARYNVDANPIHQGVTTWNGNQGIHVKSVMIGDNEAISQGVVLKLAAFPEIETTLTEKNENLGEEKGSQDTMETDFSSILGVKKWELSAKEALNSLGKPPVFIPKTGIERVQNIKTLFTSAKYTRTTYQESVKMDGAAMTIYYVKNDSTWSRSLPTLPEQGAKTDNDNNNNDATKGRFGVCSRNLDLLESDKNLYWQIALRYGLQARLARVGRNIAIQGELVGQTITQNRHGFARGAHDFFVYSIYDIDTRKYLHPGETELRARQLGVPHVPVLGYVRIPDIAESQEDLLKRAEGTLENNGGGGGGGGGEGGKREGLVYKCIDTGRMFKVIANDYLLKHGE